MSAGLTPQLYDKHRAAVVSGRVSVPNDRMDTLQREIAAALQLFGCEVLPETDRFYCGIYADDQCVAVYLAACSPRGTVYAERWAWMNHPMVDTIRDIVEGVPGDRR